MMRELAEAMTYVAIVIAAYPPGPVVSAKMRRGLAVLLAGNGAQMAVLCPFPTRPMGAQYPEYRNN